MPKRLGVASRDRPSRAYGLRHVTIIRESVITKWFPNMGKLSGTSSLCPFEKVIRFLLAQILLGSDYSPSVKELRRLLQPVLSKASLNKSLKGGRVMIAFFVNYSTVAFPLHLPTLKRQQFFGAVANSLGKNSYFPLPLDLRRCVAPTGEEVDARQRGVN